MTLPEEAVEVTTVWIVVVGIVTDETTDDEMALVATDFVEVSAEVDAEAELVVGLVLITEDVVAEVVCDEEDDTTKVSLVTVDKVSDLVAVNGHQVVYSVTTFSYVVTLVDKTKVETFVVELSELLIV